MTEIETFKHAFSPLILNSRSAHFATEEAEFR